MSMSHTGGNLPRDRDGRSGRYVTGLVERRIEYLCRVDSATCMESSGAHALGKSDLNLDFWFTPDLLSRRSSRVLILSITPFYISFLPSSSCNHRINRLVICRSKASIIKQLPIP